MNPDFLVIFIILGWIYFMAIILLIVPRLRFRNNYNDAMKYIKYFTKIHDDEFLIDLAMQARGLKSAGERTIIICDSDRTNNISYTLIISEFRWEVKRSLTYSSKNPSGLPELDSSKDIYFER